MDQIIRRILVNSLLTLLNKLSLAFQFSQASRFQVFATRAEGSSYAEIHAQPCQTALNLTYKFLPHPLR